VQAEQSTEWMRAQLTLPQAVFSTGELALLSGLNLRRVRRYLQRKRIIPERNDGEVYDVELEKLIRDAPEFWRSIRFRVSKIVGDEERS
jgi:hypothetical protein